MVTSFPLDHILHNRESTGRIVEWDVKLGEFNLCFICTHTIKSRVLANFLAEWTLVPEEKEGKLSADPGHRDPEH